MPRTARSDPTARLIGQAIRQARHEAGLTQAELARRLETTAPYITNVEAGRANLTVGQLASIAAALDAVIEISLRVVEQKPLVIRRTASHQR
jgi:transcriptional regulator with XRE-family HTH domain